MGKITTEHLRVGGMTCVSCQNRIEKSLRNMSGVNSVTVSYSGGYADISYDESVVSAVDICADIERLDYTVEKSSTTKTKHTVGLVIIIAALSFLLSQLNLTNSLPLVESSMGYGMIFLIGLLTSVHCVAMCGGICLTQTIGNTLKSSALYNIGRVISYTVVGFVVGALGSVISLDGAFKGTVQMIAGIFMVIMGVNMLGIFPWLRKLTLHIPMLKTNRKSPLIVGLLNGLMPCGPLQAMQVYALSTGSPVKGALAMFLFSLGTVPLMFGLGALSSIMTKQFTQKIMAVGAVFVTVLGLVMFSQGTALSGLSLDNLLHSKERVSDATESTVIDGVQLVTSTLNSGSYPKITVQQGIPVKWTIDAPQGSINGCNKSLYIPEYGMEYAFKQGENTIAFTPDQKGIYQYSCWMGMIRGTITVVDQSADTAQKAG